MQTLHNSTQETFYKVLLLRNTAENCDNFPWRWIQRSFGKWRRAVW